MPASRVTSTATLYTGKITFQLIPIQRAATTGITGPESEPMAFTNWPNERLRAYFPSAETSRMIGLPATCSVVAPAPSSRIVTRNIAKLDSPMTAGISRPLSMIARPSIRMNFLPLASCQTPIGTDRTPNMMKLMNGINCAAKFDR